MHLIDDEQRGFVEIVGIFFDGLFEFFQQLPFKVAAIQMQLDGNRIEDTSDADGGVGDIGDVIEICFQMFGESPNGARLAGADFIGDKRDTAALEQLVQLSEELFNLPRAKQIFCR